MTEAGQASDTFSELLSLDELPSSETVEEDSLEKDASLLEELPNMLHPDKGSKNVRKKIDNFLIRNCFFIDPPTKFLFYHTI